VSLDDTFIAFECEAEVT